ncbi:MAG: hypothetical protein CSA07_01785 [Bacteroidia bacterium]|nr:MAG: hypothetical protein CSA07_01785 [Bacteroidia bacterium]
MARKRPFRPWPLATLLAPVLLALTACIGARFVAEEACRYGGAPVSMADFARRPFGHAEQLADFRRTMPGVRPMTALSRKQKGKVDTLSDLRLPKGGKILLYRLPDGRDELIVASIRSPHVHLRNGVQVGQHRQLVGERIADLPPGDTINYRDEGPRLTRLIFGEGERLLKVEIIGVAR